MTRLNLLLAATTSTILLMFGSVRATGTEIDASIEADMQADRVAQVSADSADSADLNDGLINAPVTTGLPDSDEVTVPVTNTAVINGDLGSEQDEPNLNPLESGRTLELDAANEVVNEITTEIALDSSPETDVEATRLSDENPEETSATVVGESDAASEVETADRRSPIITNTQDLAQMLNGAIAQDGQIKLQFNENTPPPRYLNPHPNPLRFPTLAEDVTIIGDQPITLDQAIALALRNNIDLQNSIVSVQRQQENLRSAEAALWPQLDLTSNYTWSDSANARISIQRQVELTGDRSILQTDPTSTSWNTELRLRYNIFTAGSRDGNIQSARERLRLLKLEVERQTEDTRLSVSEAYYNIQNTDQSVVIAESAVINSEQSLADAQALERAGVGTQFDVLRSEVQLANDQQRLRQSQSDQQVARRTLARLLDLPPNLDISASDPIELAGTWNLPIEETIVLALRSRAELEQQLAQREIARQEQRVARASALPQLAAFASANLLDNSDDGVSGLTEGYTAGLQFSWQLFNGGATGAAVRDQELAQTAAELEFANQRNQVRLQVEQSYYQLEASLQNVSTSENALQLAKESLDLARLRFNAGVGTQTEVINAQNDLTQAEGNRVEAILGYNRALANLRRAVGNHPLTDEIDATL
jgi:OMF family outer membrane factor